MAERFGLVLALWAGVKRIIRRLFLIGNLGLGLVAIAYALRTSVWPGRFHYRSVCSVCGLEARTSEIHFGEFETQFGLTREYETNAIAALLLNHPAIKAHQHAWLFAVGGGAGVKCALGKGQPLWQTIRSSDSSEVVAFLDELVKAGDTISVLHWRDRLLNSQQSRAAALAISLAQNGGNERKNWLMAAEEEFLDSQRLGY